MIKQTLIKILNANINIYLFLGLWTPEERLRKTRTLQNKPLYNYYIFNYCKFLQILYEL